MRKLVVSAFVSLDGVMQAPGAPEEDTSGGFAHGGWTFPYWDDTMSVAGSGLDGRDRDLVLGRKTYEIFEAHWPYQPADDPIAQSLNAARKYVASTTLTSLQWNNSVLLVGEVVGAIRSLKSQPGRDLQVIGSSNLIQSLQAASLVDEYNVWTFPVVLGRGKRLFEAGAVPAALRLVRTSRSGTGVVMSAYVSAGGVERGSFASTQPSEKELARRRKASRDG